MTPIDEPTAEQALRLLTSANDAHLSIDRYIQAALDQMPHGDAVPLQEFFDAWHASRLILIEVLRETLVRLIETVAIEAIEVQRPRIPQPSRN